MILNYLDQLLDNLLNDAYTYLTNTKLVINKNQDISIIIENIKKEVNIEETIKKMLYDNKISVSNPNFLHKLYVIYYRYLYIYLFIFIGINFYAKKDQEFINLLVFTHNNYLETYFNPKVNSGILQIKKMCIQLEFMSSVKKDQLKNLPEKEFYNSLKFFETQSDKMKEIIKMKSASSRHNLVKLLMITELYLNGEKWVLTEIFEKEILSADYKYIDVYIGDYNQVDVSHLREHFLKQDFKDLPQEFIQFLREINTKEIPMNFLEKLDFLVNNGFIFLVTDEFYRYHLPAENKTLEDIDDMQQKDNLKIKGIIKKVTASKDKSLAEKNQLWYSQKKEENAITYNLFDEIRLLKKVLDDYNRIKSNVQNKPLYEELLNIQLNNFMDFQSNNQQIIIKNPTQSFRACYFENKKNRITLRNLRNNEEIYLHGFVFTNRIQRAERMKGKDFTQIDKSQIEEAIDRIFSQKPFNAYYLFKENQDIANLIDKIYENIQSKIFEHFKKYYDILEKKYKVQIDKQLFFETRFETPPDFTEYQIDLTELKSLPIISLPKKIRKSIKINRREEKMDETAIIEEKHIRCNHFLVLEMLLANKEEFTQNLFEFSKKYCIVNADEILVCKSCGTQLDIYKYVSEGSVDLYTGEYIITNVIDSSSLFEKQEYQVYYKIMKQLDKFIDDKISKIMNMFYLTGAELSNTRKREQLLKDIIDMLLLHNTYLFNYILVSNKFRGEQKVSIYEREKFNIEENLTFLFAFKLDSNILLKSSDDTDKYKVIKYHNILIYIILILILDLTESNIISLVNNHKLCNINLYDKNISYFKKLQVIHNSIGEMSSMSDFPVFCYLVTVFACMFNEYGLYQEQKENKVLAIKMIITSVIDLLNTILLINAQPMQGKSYLYQIISSRFFHKAYTIYNSELLLKRITNIQLGIKDNLYKTSKVNTQVQVHKIGDIVEYNYQYLRKLNTFQSGIKHISNHLKERQKLSKFEDLKNLLENRKEIKAVQDVRLEQIKLKTDVDVKLQDCSVEKLIVTLEKFSKSRDWETTKGVLHFDNLGLKRSKPIKFNWNELKSIPFESFFKQSVLYYQDSANKDIKIYFNSKYYHLLGYKDTQGNYGSYKGSTIYLIKEMNIQDKILNFGITSERFNIRNQVVDYIRGLNPIGSRQDIENHLYGLTKSPSISGQVVREGIEFSLRQLFIERQNNLKSIINQTKLCLYKLSRFFNTNVFKREVPNKILTLEDEYDPTIPIQTLLKETIRVAENKFDIKCEKIFKNSEFIEIGKVKLTQIDSDDKFIFDKEILLEDETSKQMIEYWNNELITFLKQNFNSNDNLRLFVFNFIMNLISVLFESYYLQNDNFFDKQLVAENYRTNFDTKLDDEYQNIDEDTDGEPDSNVDNDLAEMIKDIDQEEGNFDIDED